MEQIGVPASLMAAVAKLYQKVRCKLKTLQGFSEEFYSTMGVTQGCPLSPTFFTRYVDHLEEYMAHEVRGGLQVLTIEAFNLFLLMYVDDVVLFANDERTGQRL